MFRQKTSVLLNLTLRSTKLNNHHAFLFANFSTTNKLNAKIYDNAVDAVKDIPDGSKLLVGG